MRKPHRAHRRRREGGGATAQGPSGSRPQLRSLDYEITTLAAGLFQGQVPGSAGRGRRAGSWRVGAGSARDPPPAQTDLGQGRARRGREASPRRAGIWPVRGRRGCRGSRAGRPASSRAHGPRGPGPERLWPRRSGLAAACAGLAVSGRRAGRARSRGPRGAGAQGRPPPAGGPRGMSAPGGAQASGRGARPGGRQPRPGADCDWVSLDPGREVGW